MKLYGPDIQLHVADFLGEDDLNSEENEVFTNPLLSAMFPVLLPLNYGCGCVWVVPD